MAVPDGVTSIRGIMDVLREPIFPVIVCSPKLATASLAPLISPAFEFRFLIKMKLDFPSVLVIW